MYAMLLNCSGLGLRGAFGGGRLCQAEQPPRPAQCKVQLGIYLRIVSMVLDLQHWYKTCHMSITFIYIAFVRDSSM